MESCNKKPINKPIELEPLIARLRRAIEVTREVSALDDPKLIILNEERLTCREMEELLSAAEYKLIEQARAKGLLGPSRR